jgi:hypothetical protein
MDRQYQQYRFARIEAHSRTRHQLQSLFANGVTDVHELETAVETQLNSPANCTPWRTSEIEKTGSSDGRRLAALEFFWTHRRQLDRTN